MDEAGLALSELKALLESQGDEVSMLSDGVPPVRETIPTGSIILDQLFGIGGWPRGRVVEIFGPPSAGKTTLCYHAIAQAQKIGPVGYVDLENSADVGYASSLGVDPNSLIFCHARGGEDAFEKIEAMLRTNRFVLIVLDSIAHAKPRVVAESQIGASNVGAHAKMMTKVLDRVLLLIGDTCLICTNQIRHDPSVKFGSGEFTPGGNAMLFDAGLRVRLWRHPPEKDEDETPIFNTVTATTVKNKIGGVPFRSSKLNIYYGRGVWAPDDVLSAAIHAEVITTSGGNHYVHVQGKPEHFARSRAQALLWLEQGERLEKVRRAVLKSSWFTSRLPGAAQGEPPPEATAGSVPPDGQGSAGGDGGKTQSGPLPKVRKAAAARAGRAASPAGKEGGESLPVHSDP